MSKAALGGALWPALQRTTRQLEILAIRSFDLAERVEAGEVKFLDAVDLAYDSAYWSGLVESVGNDVVQTVLHEAFRNVRRRS
jgi:hypothetical protein